MPRHRQRDASQLPAKMRSGCHQRATFNVHRGCEPPHAQQQLILPQVNVIHRVRSTIRATSCKQQARAHTSRCHHRAILIIGSPQYFSRPATAEFSHRMYFTVMTRPNLIGRGQDKLFQPTRKRGVGEVRNAVRARRLLPFPPPPPCPCRLPNPFATVLSLECMLFYP